MMSEDQRNTTPPPEPPGVNPVQTVMNMLERADWQRLWLGTQRRAWRTLAVVPADVGVSSLEVGLMVVGMMRRAGESAEMADVRDIEFHRANVFQTMLSEGVDLGEHIVLAMSSIYDNIATVPLARAADCAILCATLGQSSLPAIKETIEQIGKDKFLGTVLLRPPPGAKPPSPARPSFRTQGARP